MVTVVAIALWSGRLTSPLRILALALAVVVAMDPWAPLAPGLWLSFGAVALIFYVSRIGEGGLILQWARVQWAVTLGLAPAALLLFGQVSVAGPLANAVAIPLVSAVVTPLALVAAVVHLDFLMHLASWFVEWLLQFLEWCAALPGALWQQHAPPLWSIALALPGVAWLLAPRGFPWRAAGLALLAPAFALSPEAPAPGTAWITTFDVGQGLAVLVRTSSRTLLYDAGPAFGPDADSGGRVVLPAMRGDGLTRLDAMVLTHEDMDHVGGATTVLESIEVDRLDSSLPERHALHALAASARACAAGSRWEWDGVQFEYLHPHEGWTARRRNDTSCVLRVRSRGGSMLLTGDIERAAEQSILQADRSSQSDVLLVPHHGSRTSSTMEFIAGVAPRWAVIPVGYRSRFGHPAADVLERYRAAGVRVLRTDLDGAVRIRLGDEGMQLETERSSAPRYWRTRPPV
jgi:competence protein ComEC